MTELENNHFVAPSEAGYLCDAKQSLHIQNEGPSARKRVSTLVRPHSGTLLISEKGRTDQHNSLDGSQMHCAKRKKPDSKGYILRIPFVYYGEGKTGGTET